jgi:O-antigen/teichoic acid export membrane protein
MMDWLDLEKWGIIAFLLLCLADEITTRIALKQTPRQGELNVILKSLMRYGRYWWSIFRWGLLFLIIVVLALYRSTDGLLFVTTIMGLTVFSNLRSILTYIWRPDYVRQTRAIRTDGFIYLMNVSQSVIISAVITYLIRHT